MKLALASSGTPGIVSASERQERRQSALAFGAYQRHHTLLCKAADPWQALDQGIEVELVAWQIS